ncbi:MAG: aminoacyl-tRNA hydrolase [Bacilli bacterium]
MKLVVGLGNPGKKYVNTHHNVGFMVLDSIVKALDLGEWKHKFGGDFIDCFVGFDKVIFLKPQNFINLSGEVMIEYVNFFDIKLDDIIIISDDLDLPLGSIKLKLKGSSGGHNGLKNIEQNLGTNEYKRIKVGISNNKNIDSKDYVLSKLSDEEKKLINPALKNASDAILSSFRTPFEVLMSRYNLKINSSLQSSGEKNV